MATTGIGERATQLPVVGSVRRTVDQIRARLKSSEIQTQSAFDRRVAPTYLVILIGAVTTTSFVVFGGFRFADPMMAVPPAWAALLIIGALLARRYGHPSIGGACETIGLVYGQGLVIESSTPALTAYSRPYADWWLARADQLLGFDWRGFVMLFRDHPLGLRIAGWAYMSFLWQAALILICLFATGRDRRAWLFVTAASVALLITVAIYPLAPAAGAFVHYGITPSMYPNLNTVTPWTFAPAIEAMKDGRKLITGNLMVGYVSFPSYHAASALLFSWAAWPLRRARWLFVPLNTAMAGSAMIIGAHYLVDIIAGGAVATLAVLISRKLVGTFQRAHSFTILQASAGYGAE